LYQGKGFKDVLYPQISSADPQSLWMRINTFLTHNQLLCGGKPSPWLRPLRVLRHPFLRGLRPQTPAGGGAMLV